jgi:23S rRNA (cytidine2498-2'-O)-methyltransferase
MSELLLLCRAGFEPECAQEITAWCARAGCPGHVRADRGSAVVRFVPASGTTPNAPSWRELIFPRQSVGAVADLCRRTENADTHRIAIVLQA